VTIARAQYIRWSAAKQYAGKPRVPAFARGKKMVFDFYLYATNQGKHKVKSAGLSGGICGD
jgi:hypothetical protein